MTRLVLPHRLAIAILIGVVETLGQVIADGMMSEDFERRLEDQNQRMYDHVHTKTAPGELSSTWINVALEMHADKIPQSELG